MQALAMHPEDIKAAIRKRHGSLAQFERTKGLAQRSATDVLRGKTSRVTAEAIAAELGHSVEALFSGKQSADADNNATPVQLHRLNEQAK